MGGKDEFMCRLEKCVNTRVRSYCKRFLRAKGDPSIPGSHCQIVMRHLTSRKVCVCVCVCVCSQRESERESEREREREGYYTKVLQSRSVPLLIRDCSQKMVADMR